MVAIMRFSPKEYEGKPLDFGKICILDVLFLPDFCKKYIFTAPSVVSDFLIMKKINSILKINHITKWYKKDMGKMISSIECSWLRYIYEFVYFIVDFCKVYNDDKLYDKLDADDNRHNDCEKYILCDWIKYMLHDDVGFKRCRIGHLTGSNNLNNGNGTDLNATKYLHLHNVDPMIKHL